MNAIQKVYAGWIEENLDHSETLKKEIVYWEGILKKQVFDGTWPKTIRAVIECFKSEVIKQIEECHYYIQQIKENKDANACPK